MPNDRKDYTDVRYRVLAVEKILDFSEKPLTVPQILDKLERIYGIVTSPHPVVNDIRVLSQFYNIRHAGLREGYYIER